MSAQKGEKMNEDDDVLKVVGFGVAILLLAVLAVGALIPHANANHAAAAEAAVYLAEEAGEAASAAAASAASAAAAGVQASCPPGTMGVAPMTGDPAEVRMGVYCQPDVSHIREQTSANRDVSREDSARTLYKNPETKPSGCWVRLASETVGASVMLAFDIQYQSSTHPNRLPYSGAGFQYNTMKPNRSTFYNVHNGKTIADELKSEFRDGLWQQIPREDQRCVDAEKYLRDFLEVAATEYGWTR